MIRLQHSGRAVLRWSQRLRRGAGSVLAGFVLVIVPALQPAGVAAHNPDPSLGGALWGQDQVVTYAWAPGQVPPTWLQNAFNAAAGDANRTRASRAAVFSLGSSGSQVAYGEPTGCSAAGIACFWRNPPGSFKVWYRANGYWFDWGQLRWCQAAGFSTGCYDAENVGLDELGHVLGLDHHVNWPDQSDYGDAVVQAVTRTFPKTGSTAYAFGRCDQARLQLLYERQSSWSVLSSCLALPSQTGIGVSATSITAGGSVLFYGSLRVSTSAAAGNLTGDWVSGRTLVLERRFLGGSTWTPVATMTPQAVGGSYAVTVSITGTYEWRVTFTQPSGEGLLGSSSVAVPIYVQSCSVCPNAATNGSSGL